MALKVFQPLTTPPASNEQTGVGQATVTTAGGSQTFQSRGIGAGADKALFLLSVSAASGTTPSLQVTVQAEDPGSLNWVDIATFDPQTAVSAAPVTIDVNPFYFQKVRVVATATGSGASFTFTCGAMFMSSEPVA